MNSSSEFQDATTAVTEAPIHADKSECPSDDTLRSLAKSDLSGDDELQTHLEHCERCAQEYRDYARDNEWNRFITRSTKASYFVILAIIISEIIRHFSHK